MRLLLALVGGAAFAYFLDPDRGRRRRNMARDRLGALVRRQSARVVKLTRRAADAAYGVAQEVTHAPDIRVALDDATLARKVESEIFRDPTIRKDSINVNAEDGVVVLRGQVERPEHLVQIEAAARRVPDALDVHNLLHLPGQPAPNKAEAIAAGRLARAAPPNTPPRRTRTGEKRALHTESEPATDLEQPAA